MGGSQPALVDGRKKDLDRIQDLFPQDYLGLHDPDAATTQSASVGIKIHSKLYSNIFTNSKLNINIFILEITIIHDMFVSTNCCF